MTIEELRYFVEVCACTSISEASRILHISQQGLSICIKNLEQELTQPLFERTSRGVTLTSFGDSFYTKVLPVVNEYNTLLNFVANVRKDNCGQINIGDSKCSYLVRELADCLAIFMKGNPSINITMHEFDTEKNCTLIENGSLDLGIEILPVDEEKFQIIQICKINLKLIAHKQNKLNDFNVVNFCELKNEPFGLPLANNKISSKIKTQCEEHGFSPNIYYTSDHFGLLAQMVNKNFGISFIPERDADKVIKTFNDISVLNIYPPIEVNIAFIFKKHMQRTKAMNSLISFVLGDSEIIKNY